MLSCDSLFHVTRKAAFAAVALVCLQSVAFSVQAFGKSTAKPAAPEKSAAAQKTAADGAKPASAAGPQASTLGTFGDWSVHVSQQGKTKLCYALSQPKERLPKGLNRDPGFLFVSMRPAENVRNEVSFVLGFAAKDGASTDAVIGQGTFAVVTKGANAWIKNTGEEPQVVSAMTKNASLVLKATSKRGNAVSDRYSLSGFGQALDRVKKECP